MSTFENIKALDMKDIPNRLKSKEKYNGYIIFIKVKDRYYTYDDDLLYMNNLFDIKYYYFRYSKLFNIKVNYVILDSNKIIIN